jgi:DNA-binding transcriptional LysR family regulator
MELRHLRYFVAVAEALSFSRAAVRLRLAQPSLSKQIKDLEAELGMPLLERDRNHVALTDAGAVFLKEARQVLARAEVAVKRARDAAAGARGELHIATMGPLTFSFLPLCLTKFRGQIPRARVTVTEMPPSEQFSKVAAGDIQVGFVPAPLPRAAARQLVSTPILLSPLVVMMAPDHPLAKGSSVKLRDLDDETFLHIRLHGAETQRAWTQELCRRVGFTPRFGAGASNPDNLVTMVAAGEGVALIPKIAQRGPAPGCAYLRVAESRLAYELVAITSARHSSVLTKQFLNICVGEGAEVQAQMSGQEPAARKSRR